LKLCLGAKNNDLKSLDGIAVYKLLEYLNK